MSSLPYCDICKKQIVNAPGIGWYCPTVGCEGGWPQKANIVFDYKDDASIIKEQQATINLLVHALEKTRVYLISASAHFHSTQHKELGYQFGERSDEFNELIKQHKQN